MRNKLSGLVLAIFLLLASGCATYTIRKDFGTITLTTNNITKIQKGVTTQQDILEIFGEPFSKSYLGELGWMWTYTRTISEKERKDSIDDIRRGFKAGAMESLGAGPIRELPDITCYSLTVMFDEMGKVKDYHYTEVKPIQKGTVSIEEK
ncbi:hypothetical protein KAW55_06365 [bacterium]|nr:hypothetical protein [bacterium]